MLGIGNIDGTGNALNNVITGSAGSNVLSGAASADNMRGLAGNDVYIVSSTGDVVDESLAGSTGIDTLAIVDQLQPSRHDPGAGSVENLTLRGTGNIDGTGNALNNVITGNARNNVLSGGAGADNMRGLAGNDVYIVNSAGDTVDESLAGSTGIDTVAVLDQLQPSQHDPGAGLSRKPDAAWHRQYQRHGQRPQQWITGNAGINVLSGGAGNDTLTGGAGTDYFVFNTALSASSNVDRITDFNVLEDTIRLENAGSRLGSTLASTTSGNARTVSPTTPTTASSTKPTRVG